jgi:hypothetical protein
MLEAAALSGAISGRVTPPATRSAANYRAMVVMAALVIWLASS